jgi:hypothetical protein
MTAVRRYCQDLRAFLERLHADAAARRVHPKEILIDRDIEHVPQERDFAVDGRLANRFQTRDTVLKNALAFDLTELRYPEKIDEILHQPRLAIVALFVDAHGGKIRLGEIFERGRRIGVGVGPVFLRQVDLRCPHQLIR